MKLNRTFYARFLVISIIICMISMIGSTLVKTNFGSIETSDFSILDSKGDTVACTMYRPKAATPENPAPCVVTLHGSYNGRESQESLCLELAKRGFVSITMDCDGHGDSSSYKDNPMDAFFLVTANPGSDFADITTAPTSGMADVVDYVYNNLAFVDRDHIGITGHSLGAKTTNACYAYYKLQEYFGGVNKIAAVFLMGNQQLSVKGAWQDHLTYDPDNVPGSGDEIPLYYDVDYGVSGATFDENNYTTEAGGPWNFSHSNNARTFVNELDDYNLSKDQSLEVGKYYKGTVHGSDKEYLRVLYQPHEIHMLNPYSPATTRNAVDFFQHSFTAPSPINSSSLTMQYMQMFNAIGLVGFFCVIFSACCLMLTTGFFRSLLAASPSDVYRPAPPNTKTAAVLYWSFMILGSLIPIFYMMKLAMWIGGHKGATFATRSLFGTKIWPQGLILEQGIWAASAGLLTFVLFSVRYYLSRKKAGTHPSQWNMAIDRKNLGKTVLLAICSVSAGYLLVGIGSYFFNANFSLLNYVVRWPAKDAFLISLRYMILFALFYFGNSFTQNIGRMISTRKEWANTLLMCFINCFGLLGLWIYQYATFAQVGSVPLNSARVMATWNFFIVQCLCTVISRRLYLKTGKIYLGALINTIMFTLIACAHTMTLVCSNWWF